MRHIPDTNFQSNGSRNVLSQALWKYRRSFHSAYVIFPLFVVHLFDSASLFFSEGMNKSKARTMKLFRLGNSNQIRRKCGYWVSTLLWFLSAQFELYIRIFNGENWLLITLNSLTFFYSVIMNINLLSRSMKMFSTNIYNLKNFSFILNWINFCSLQNLIH